jgi:hypothetical protein
MLRYDRAPIKATRTDAGFLLDSPILTRTGVFQYREPSGRVRREYRPAEVVFAQDSLARYKAIPITDGHPGEVTSANARKHMIGVVLSEGRQDGSNVTADVVIHELPPKNRELSVGYRVTLDENPGTTPEGEEYDVKLTGIFPNHLAIVERGRAGNARLNLDAADAVSVTTEEDETMTTVKVRLDSAPGIEYEASPEVALALAAAQAAVKTATDRADALAAERDGLKAAADKHAADLVKARADALEQVAGRVKLENEVKAVGVKFAQDASDSDIRGALIKHVRGDAFDLTGKNDAYLQAAYDFALADAVKAKDVAGKNRADAHQKVERKDGEDSAASARDKYIARLTASAK